MAIRIYNYASGNGGPIDRQIQFHRIGGAAGAIQAQFFTLNAGAPVVPSFATLHTHNITVYPTPVIGGPPPQPFNFTTINAVAQDAILTNATARITVANVPGGPQPMPQHININL